MSNPPRAASSRVTATLLTALALTVPTASRAGADAARPAAALDDTEGEARRASHRRDRRPRHARMAAEATGMLVIGTAWYWRPSEGRMGGANVVDWQLGWGRSAFERKLSLGRDGWRFDGNSYGLNAVGHPMFGALTYFAARKNGYGVGESFLVSTAASGAWELFTEWAEYGSINDMLSTSTTGVPLGEVGYQLARHWRRASYAVEAGAGTEAGAPVATVGAAVALDTLPASRRALVGGGRKVSAGVEVTTDGGVRSVEGAARSTLVGTHLTGDRHRLFVGATTAFAYRERMDRDERGWDLLTTVGGGPAVDGEVRDGDLRVRFGLDLHLEFAMARAQAFDAWRAEHPGAVVRNSMQDKERPYYYAGAVALTPQVAVDYRGLDAGARVAARTMGSLDGADRDQEMLTADPHIADTDVVASAWAGVRRGGLRLGVQGRLRHRRGTMDEATGERTDRTALVSLSVHR